MHELTYHTLSDVERASIGERAKAATTRLANGETFADMPLSELSAYCVVSELNLAVALVELTKRLTGDAVQ
jgi:hypothetical protein